MDIITVGSWALVILGILLLVLGCVVSMIDWRKNQSVELKAKADAAAPAEGIAKILDSIAKIIDAITNLWHAIAQYPFGQRFVIIGILMVIVGCVLGLMHPGATKP